MIRSKISKFKLLYLGRHIFLIYILVYIQSLFLARTNISWLCIDFLSILIGFLSLETGILFAALHAIIAGFLLQAHTLLPSLFFPMYFLFMVAGLNNILKFFLTNSLISKTILFASFIFLKYILFYLSLMISGKVDFLMLVSLYWKEFLSTIVFFPLSYQLLLNFEALFFSFIENHTIYAKPSNQTK